jgi:hypothetical protein
MHRFRALMSGALTVVLSTALAAALTVGSPPEASVDSEGLRLAATTQVARLRMHPQIAQPGSAVTSPTYAKSSMSAEFRPIRKGRKVVLQQKRGTRWVNLKYGAENAKGIVDFVAPYRYKGKIAKYRTSALKSGRLAKVTSAVAYSNKWGGADFTDQFSGTTLNASYWSDRVEGDANGHNAAAKRSCAKASPAARRVANGALRLSVMRDPNPPKTGGLFPTTQKCPVTNTEDGWRINGFIGTHGKKSFKYGYMAARMKFQPHKGSHAAFWMWPETREATSGSAKLTGAEIDVIEWFGDRANPDTEMQSCIYYYPTGTPVKAGGQIPDHHRFGADWTTKYHVFSVEWTPTKYIFRIDGKETYRTTKGVSGQREMLMLSLLSSDYELKLQDPSKLPAHMYVDWVRVWNR